MNSASQRKSAVRFISTMSFVVLLVTALTLLLSYAQFGRHTVASFALCQGVNSRLSAASRIFEPKLVLIGGSGVRRGVNARIIAGELGVPTLNFGLQAALGPAIILHEAKKTLRPDDTALLLFEFNHFSYDQLTTVAIDYVYGCRRKYFSSGDLGDKLTFLFNVGPARVIKSLTFQPPKDRCLNCTEGEELEPASGPISVGDVPLTETMFPPLSRDRKARMALYRPITISVDRQSKGPEAIAEFVDWARANSVNVIASWPNTVNFPEYKKSDGFKKIADFYRSLDVPMLGEPSIALLPLRFFYDTQYHLNIDGIVLRSRRLAIVLRRYIASLTLATRTAKQ